MYVSGDKVESPNILKRFVMYGVLAIVVVVGLGWYLMHSLTHHENETKTKKTHKDLNNTVYAAAKTYEDNNNKYLILRCIKFTCKNLDYQIKLNIKDLEFLLKDTDSKYLHSNQKSDSRADIYLLVSSQFIELFNKNKGVRNEKGFNIIN